MVLMGSGRLYNPLSGGSSARTHFRRTNHNDEAFVGTVSEHLNPTQRHMWRAMRGNMHVRFGGRGQENPRPRGRRRPFPDPTPAHRRLHRLRQRSGTRQAAAAAARPVQLSLCLRTLGSEPTRSQHGAASLDDIGAGAIVAGRHPLPHPRCPNAPPGRKRAEVVHETPWGRRPTAKALFGSTHSVSSIRPWSRSRPSDGRVPPAAIVRGHSRSLTAQRAPVRAVAASEQQSQAGAQVS